MTAPAPAWAPDPDALEAAPVLVHDDGDVRVWRGDCRHVLPYLPADSVHSVVTDPPYDLTAGKKGGTGEASLNLATPYGRARISTGNSGGFMGQDWDATGVAFDPATWAEVYRVLRPGGYLVAFGGTRTYHRLATAIEDAGFEIRDSLHWIYGQGFPKSLDVGKAIDKAAGAVREVVGERTLPDGRPVRTVRGTGNHEGWDRPWKADEAAREANLMVTAPATADAATWDGWGTALKPAHEPIVLARKPLAGTVAANVLAHGTGGLNVDGCRIAEAGGSPSLARRETAARSGTIPQGGAIMDNRVTAERYLEERAGELLGRWPTNVLFSHAPGCVQTGTRRVRAATAVNRNRDAVRPQTVAGAPRTVIPIDHTHAGPDGREEVPVYACAPGCPVADLDAQSGVHTSGTGAFRRQPHRSDALNPLGTLGREEVSYGDTGGASRFFPIFRYEAKAPTDERPRDGQVAHPTVKPLDLMRWLVRLVTPPGGTVLDLFAGSGTTGEAAIVEGFLAILIERHGPYVPLVLNRITKPIQPTMFGDL